MDLHLARRDTRGTAVLAVTGEVDVATSGEFHAELWRLIDEHVGETVIVDLRGVTSMDHLGLGIVVGALARAVGSGGDLTLVCGPSRLLDTLTASRLDRAFVIHPTVVEAAESTT
jgi:anti-sigma B factor antagonist